MSTIGCSLHRFAAAVSETVGDARLEQDAPTREHDIDAPRTTPWVGALGHGTKTKAWGC